jgi:hypothetical protein
LIHIRSNKRLSFSRESASEVPRILATAVVIFSPDLEVIVIVMGFSSVGSTVAVLAMGSQEANTISKTSRIFRVITRCSRRETTPEELISYTSSA